MTDRQSMVRLATSPTPLLAFVALACAVSWALWLPLALAGSSTPPLSSLHLLGGLGPAIAGLVCARWFGGKPALQLVVKRIGLWQTPPSWHLVAWLGPFALVALAMLVASLAGEPAKVPLAQSPEFPNVPVSLYWAAVLIFYGFGEEIGWRGFALPVLQRTFSPAVATLILSVIWAAWHLPLFWFSAGLSAMDAAGIAGWYASLLTGAAILTWLTNSTRGSILLAAAFHATMDIAFSPSISPLATTTIGIVVTIWGIVVLGWLMLPWRAAPVTLPLLDVAGR
jgi:membrane protease YdiL (CAAX protease family)